MSSRRPPAAALAVALFAAALTFWNPPASAQIPNATSISFSSDTAEVTFEISTYEMDVKLTFENVVGLSPPAT